MAWVGVCYEGADNGFLKRVIEKNEKWLKGDRNPRLYGDNFMIIYDSNTAREFLKKIKAELMLGKIMVYTIPSVLMEFER